MRRKGITKDDENEQIYCDDDDEKFVTNQFDEIQDGCQNEDMAVKRLVEKRPQEGASNQDCPMEGGPEGGQKSPIKMFERSVSEVKNWTDLMNTLSPKGKKNTFPEDPPPEISKSDDDAFIDDLPLGSEANTLSAVTCAESSCASHPPLDSRLAILKTAPGNPAWSSFHSEVSAQTSGSSANSLDILLSQRNVDPEHMLRSLGFGFVQEQEPGMLRVPLRFMQGKSSANGISIEEFLEENPDLQRLVLKKSGGAAGWKNLSKSISTMAAMKSLTGRPLTAAAAAATASASASPSPLGSTTNIPGLPGVADSHPEFLRHSSILILENQQALAKQGYYDVHIPKDDKKNGKGSSGSGHKGPMDAASRRAQYQKAKSKRWSMIESGDDFPCEDSCDWMSKSLDESRGRLSGTDFSSSMDSSDSPANHSRTSSISEKRRQLEEDMKRHSITQSALLASVRQSLEAEAANQDEDDNDDNLSVSPYPSKQNTIEKSPTLTDNDEKEGRHVRIVVSDTDPSKQDVADGRASISKTHAGTQSLLTIVSAQIERLSDSGSDYTLVESPRPSVDAGVPHPELQQSVSKDSVFESQKAEKSVSCQTSLDSCHLDENDNHAQNKAKVGSGSHNQEDLPRMASVQSDSSGFGDTDNTGDLVAPDIDRTMALSLGSSSESAGTLASSNTTVPAHDVVTDIATQTSLSEHSNNFVSEYGASLVPPTWEITPPQSVSRTTSEKCENSETHEQNTQASRYISTVYIPPVSKIHSPWIIKQSSGSTIGGKGLVLEKPRVSVIVPNQSQTAIETPATNFVSKFESQPRKDEEVSFKVRAPLAQPEQFDSDEDRRERAHGKFEAKKSEISVLNLSVADSHEFGSRISLVDPDESDYSCSSVADSTASCSTGEVLDYRKLVRLINQPTQHKGRKRSIVRYRPKKQIRDWPNLYRKKRIQEETRLLQHAVLKYKTELHTLETSCILQYQQAYEDFSEEEREEVEDLQAIGREIRNQLQTLEQLLAHRMKAVARGNDFFSFLSSLGVIQKMTEMLKEQVYQQMVSTSLEQQQRLEVDEEDYDEDEHDSHASSFYSSRPIDQSSPHFMSGYGSPFGMYNDPRPYQDPHQNLEEMRRGLMDEMKQELDRSTQQLYLDMQAKDNEIQRLNLEIMMQSRHPPRRPRPGLMTRRTRQTDV